MSGVSEAEKNRFNYNFEIIQGDELKSEEILRSLESINDKINGLEVVSNKILKINIDQSKNNQEQFKRLKEYIEKDKNKTYSLKAKYDDQTGLVNKMILTILEKKR